MQSCLYTVLEKINNLLNMRYCQLTNFFQCDLLHLSTNNAAVASRSLDLFLNLLK